MAPVFVQAPEMMTKETGLHALKERDILQLDAVRVRDEISCALLLTLPGIQVMLIF